MKKLPNSVKWIIILVVLAAMVYWTVSQTDRTTAQVGATGQSLMQSQRLAKSVSQALIGGTEAFTEVKESSQALARDVHSLQNGGGSAPAGSSTVTTNPLSSISVSP